MLTAEEVIARIEDRVAHVQHIVTQFGRTFGLPFVQRFNGDPPLESVERWCSELARFSTRDLETAAIGASVELTGTRRVPTLHFIVRSCVLIERVRIEREQGLATTAGRKPARHNHKERN